MDVAVEFQAFKRPFEPGHVGEIPMVECKTAVAGRDKAVTPVKLEADLVMVIEVIDGDNCVAARAGARRALRQ
jgi:hypothetical protein